MVSFAALLAVASVVSATTPPGFLPSVSNGLIVEYGTTLINAQVVERNLTQTRPRIATRQQLNGTSYAVFMVDLGIPTDSPPVTSTLLHWLQTGLTPASTSTSLAGSNGFLLQNGTSLAPLATYIGPNPPARVPLSHRYTFLLVDTSDSGLASDRSASANLTSLTAAALMRRGFNVQKELQSLGLSNRVVAANYFNVTNPGPVQGIATGTDSGTGSAPGATSTGNPVTAGARGSFSMALWDGFGSSSSVSKMAALGGFVMAVMFAL